MGSTLQSPPLGAKIGEIAGRAGNARGDPCCAGREECSLGRLFVVRCILCCSLSETFDRTASDVSCADTTSLTACARVAPAASLTLRPAPASLALLPPCRFTVGSFGQSDGVWSWILALRERDVDFFFLASDRFLSIGDFGMTWAFVFTLTLRGVAHIDQYVDLV